MNTEKKVLLGGFALYSLLTLLLVLQSQQPEQSEIISYDDKKGVSKTLLGPRFAGRWSANSTGGLLSHAQGRAKASFVRVESYEFDEMFELRLDSSLYLVLQLLDPEFRDDRFLRIIQPLASANATSFAFEKVDKQRLPMNVCSFANFNDFLEAHNSTFRGSIRFSERVFLKEGLNASAVKDTADLLAVSLLDDAPGGLALEARLAFDRENRTRKSLLYTYFLVAVALLNYWGAASIFERIADNPGHTRRLNKATILLVCLQDCFVFLYNIQLGFAYLDTWNYIFVILIYFVLFCFVDYRLLLYVWRYQDARAFEDLTEYQFRNKLYVFQMKVYLLIIGYIYLMWKFFVHVDLVFLNSFVLLPQILHHMASADPPFFELDFLGLFSAAKYLVFLYLRACPRNILEIHFYFLLPFAGLGVICLCLLVVWQQENYGSKFFVPKIFKKGQFDYFVELRALAKKPATNAENSGLNESSGEENFCVICLTDLKRQGKDQSLANEPVEIQNKVLKRILRRKGDKWLMVTPCKHAFHPACLAKWMEIKMECPHCRAPLPPLSN